MRDTLGLVRLEVEEYLRGSFLENAPIVAVSAKTRARPDSNSRTSCIASRAKLPGKDAARHFRLPIDRAFAIKGFGAVVTGTLISGSVRAGDEVELFPSGANAFACAACSPAAKPWNAPSAGQRTAVNLAGIEHTALQRGMVLAAPGKFRADAPNRCAPRTPFLRAEAETAQPASIFTSAHPKPSPKYFSTAATNCCPVKALSFTCACRTRCWFCLAIASSCGNFRQSLRSAAAWCWMRSRDDRSHETRAGRVSRNAGTRRPSGNLSAH